MKVSYFTCSVLTYMRYVKVFNVLEVTEYMYKR